MAHFSTAKGRACTTKCLPSPTCSPDKFFGRRERFVQAGVSARRHGILLPG
jgi:hypothetical protein